MDWLLQWWHLPTPVAWWWALAAVLAILVPANGGILFLGLWNLRRLKRVRATMLAAFDEGLAEAKAIYTDDATKLHRGLTAMSAVSLHQTGRMWRWPEGVALPTDFIIGHPLTCGNDSDHTPLYPVWDGERVTLICADCDYTQDNAGMFGRVQ